MTVLVFIYLLAMVCWLGAIIFFSFFTAPVVFTRLPIAEAGKVISSLFPRYYLLGYVAGANALLLAIYFMVVTRGARTWWIAAAVAIGLGLGCTCYAGMVIRPRVDAIRTVAEEQNPDPARKAEFDRLHRLSVTLNGAVLLLDLAALFASAGALTPRG
jgi:p-aminobenzoyl-glutamate transporter AbgT